MFLKKSKQLKIDDDSKSFIDHLEDLRWVLFKSVLSILIFSIIAFFKIEIIFNYIVLGPAHSNFITYKILCKLGKLLNLEKSICLQDVQIKLQSNQMSSQFMMSFTMAFIVGFIISFPFLIYLLWDFIKPALKKEEIKKIKYIVLWVSILFFLGVFFGYYIITPYAVNFFASYTLSPLIENNFLLSDYIDTVVQLVIGTGIVFQLPLLIYVLTKIGIINSAFLKNNRKYALVFILIIAAVITPPDVVSQLLVTIPLWLLYEIGINISKRVEKNRAK